MSFFYFSQKFRESVVFRLSTAENQNYKFVIVRYLPQTHMYQGFEAYFYETW
jgi:hypothetical protein